jgi:DNA polymerase-3 subunit beta
MKFVSNASVLGSKLNALKRVINAKNSLAVLDDFLLELSGNELKATASDGEIFVTSVIEVTGEEDGDCCVQARQITTLLSAIGDDAVTFSQNEIGGSVKTAKGTFNFPTEVTEAYPQPTIPDDMATLTLDAVEFVNALQRVEFAAGTDDLRPVMCGVAVDLAQGAYVASDGHKLIKAVVEPKEGQELFIMSRKAIAMAGALLGKNKDVELSKNASCAVISDESVRIVCRLVEGRYPNYNSVIPNIDTMQKVRIDRKKLLGAIKRVAVFGNQSSNCVVLKASWTDLRINAKDIDFSTSAEEHIECEYAGPEIEIGFKGDFLVTLLSAYENDEVEIYLADSSKAAILKDDSGVVSLIMPMMIE